MRSYNCYITLSKVAMFRCTAALHPFRSGVRGIYHSHYHCCALIPFSLASTYLYKVANQNRWCFPISCLEAPFFSGSRLYSSFATDERKGALNKANAATSDFRDADIDSMNDASCQACQSVTDLVSCATLKVKDAFDSFNPHIHHLFDTFPFLNKVITPMSGTLAATVLAWMVLPKIFRNLHAYSLQGPATLLLRNLAPNEVPYEKSLWAALEDPLRYLVTFMAFSQLCVLVAPTTIASQYIGQAWRGAFVLSLVWFLHRWKSNVLAHTLAMLKITGIDRERLIALDKLSSAGLLALGLMGTAEACGVAVQSILTVGGIGGVATAFAGRDILGNILSGLSLQFSRPFSVGDTIKAGHVEGVVVEMGMTSISLLNSDKFPVSVPNSFFLSQAIVNKTRAGWQAMATKIPLQVSSLNQIPWVSEDIKSMLRAHPKVFLDKEPPYCFLSRIESSFMELSIGCNLQHMTKEELYVTEQDILLQAAQIIKKHGAELGNTVQF